MARDSRRGFPERGAKLGSGGLRSRAVGAIALAVVLLGAGFSYAFPYAVDDAYIVVRYGTRLAGGLGYTFNPGAPTDGVTGPLWLFLAAAAARAGASPLLTLKLAGAVCAGLAVLTVVRVAQGRTLGGRAAYLCAALCVSSAPLVVWGVAGLETGLATLLATWLGVSTVARNAEPRATLVRVTVALLALPWLRPELVPFAAATAGAFALRTRTRLPVLALLLGLLGVALFRWRLFGHVLPMTSAAKPPELAHGLRYLLACLRPLPALALTATVLLGVRLPRFRVLLAALSVHGVAVALAGGDWMPAARLCVPVVPCAALLASHGFVHAFARRARLGALLFTALLAIRLVGFEADVGGARAAGLARSEGVAELVRALPSGGGPIVALDIGMLGVSVDARIIDLGGLTEPRLAYARGGHLDKRLDGPWLEAQTPRAIVLHSEHEPRVDALGRVRWFAGYPVERRVLALPWVFANYRVSRVTKYDARYYYIVLAPRSGANESVKR